MSNLPLLHPPPPTKKFNLYIINVTHAMQPRAINASPCNGAPCIGAPCNGAPCNGAPCNGAPCYGAHIILSVELLESQQKADVVKTDYSDSLLMITRLKTRMMITIDAAHI